MAWSIVIITDLVCVQKYAVSQQVLLAGVGKRGGNN